MAAFSTLPNELRLTVLQYVDLDGLLALRRTSKALREAAMYVLETNSGIYDEARAEIISGFHPWLMGQYAETIEPLRGLDKFDWLKCLQHADSAFRFLDTVRMWSNGFRLACLSIPGLDVSREEVMYWERTKIPSIIRPMLAQTFCIPYQLFQRFAFIAREIHQRNPPSRVRRRDIQLQLAKCRFFDQDMDLANQHFCWEEAEVFLAHHAFYESLSDCNKHHLAWFCRLLLEHSNYDDRVEKFLEVLGPSPDIPTTCGPLDTSKWQDLKAKLFWWLILQRGPVVMDLLMGSPFINDEDTDDDDSDDMYGFVPPHLIEEIRDFNGEAELGSRAKEELPRSFPCRNIKCLSFCGDFAENTIRHILDWQSAGIERSQPAGRHGDEKSMAWFGRHEHRRKLMNDEPTTRPSNCNIWW